MPPQEVATNLVAAFVADGRAAEVPALLAAMKLASGGSFELAFNRACGQLSEGNLGAAEEQLQLAMRIGGYAGQAGHARGADLLYHWHQAGLTNISYSWQCR